MFRLRHRYHLHLFVACCLTLIGCGNSSNSADKKTIVISTEAPRADHPVVVIGAGISGMTAGLYLTMAGYAPLIVQGPTVGGLITQSHSVRNWPGEIDTSGIALAEKLHVQLTGYHVAFDDSSVVELNCQEWPYEISLKNASTQETRTITAASIILAMGTTPNYLGIPGEQSYWGGKGVTNCAVCEGSLYTGKTVGVVGGGDAAVTEALYLSRIAKEVHVFVRKDALRARDTRKEVMLNTPNITIHFSTAVTKILGDETKISSVELMDTVRNTTRTMALDGLFLAIGSTPNSTICKGQIPLDAAGYIVRTTDQATEVPGIFAAGDITDPVYKQAITGAGDGCKAALQAIHFLENAGYGAQKNTVPPTEQNNVEESPAPHKEALDTIVHIKTPEELTGLLAQKRPVVIDFYATWCPPCRRMTPVFEAYAHTHAKEALFIKVNIDEAPEIAYQFSVRSIPTFIGITASGQEKQRYSGIISEAQLQNLHQ